MELKSTFSIAFFLVLVLFRPILSQGRLKMADFEPEIYQIDYRGPETHSYVPPPNRSGRFAHQESLIDPQKLEGSRTGRVRGDHGEAVHP